MTQFDSVFRFNRWTDQGDDTETVYLLEKKALDAYNKLLSGSLAPSNASVTERMSDLYIELNTEKRYSMELSERLNALQDDLSTSRLSMDLLQAEVVTLRERNAALSSEIDLEKSRFQRVREDLYSSGERGNVLSRISFTPPDVQKLQEKISLLQQRIFFLEKT